MIAYAAALSAMSAAILVLIAFNDLRRLRIPNILCLALVALFLFRAPTLPIDEIGWRLVRTLAVFAATYTLFLTERFGAGDAKLLTALTLHAPGEFFALWIMALSVCSAAAILLVLSIKWTLRPAAEPMAAEGPGSGGQAGPLQQSWRSWGVWRERGRFPLGYPIAASGIMLLAFDFWRLVATG